MLFFYFIIILELSCWYLNKNYLHLKLKYKDVVTLFIHERYDILVYDTASVTMATVSGYDLVFHLISYMYNYNNFLKYIERPSIDTEYICRAFGSDCSRHRLWLISRVIKYIDIWINQWLKHKINVSIVHIRSAIELFKNSFHPEARLSQ